ncbi:MAG: hypothetical protein JST00_46040, partial [Deltaproteobacteria bacterium]|nr:hypothetical protein [Deltaproteobacteria bacterium]
MGVARWTIRCAGCDATITLRLGVGYAPRQPFFLVCPACAAVTHGAHVLDEQTMRTSLELDDGSISYDEGPSVGTVTIHPEFPCVPDRASMAEPDGSPYLMQIGFLGHEAPPIRWT